MAVTDDSPAVLHCGDALRLLADMPDAAVDAVITDPPYSSGGWSRGDRMQATGTKYGGERLADFAGDTRDQRAHLLWCNLWLTEAMRVTKPGGLCLLFTDWRQLPLTTDALQIGGWVWRGIVPWVKPNARPQPGGFAAQCEYVVWGSRGALPRDYAGGVYLPGFVTAHPPRDRQHQTQKPVAVMRELVRVVPRGGLILDPFAGSGTTGVAALAEGRRFVGFELTEHYAAVARDRLRHATEGYCADEPEQTALAV